MANSLIKAAVLQLISMATIEKDFIKERKSTGTAKGGGKMPSKAKLKSLKKLKERKKRRAGISHGMGGHKFRQNTAPEKVTVLKPVVYAQSDGTVKAPKGAATKGVIQKVARGMRLDAGKASVSLPENKTTPKAKKIRKRDNG